MRPIYAALRRILRQRSLSILLVLLATGFFANRAQATNWKGGNLGTGKWEDTGNWDAGLPSSGVDATIGTGTLSPTNPASALIDDTTGAATVANLFIGDTGTNSGTLTMTGGSLTPAGAFDVGGNGTANGNGTFILSGGTVNMTAGGQTFSLAIAGHSNTLANGTMQMSDGQLNINNGSFSMGRQGIASMSLTGGTVNLSGTTGLFIANGSTSFGGFTLDGGTLLVDTGSIEVSRNVGTGSFILKSGFLQVSSAIRMVNNSGGHAEIDGQAGTWNLPTISMLSARGNATLSVSGASITTTQIDTDNGGGTLGFSSILISGGSLAVGTITLSPDTTNLANSSHIIQSGGELSVLKIGQSNNNQDVQFNGGTLTIGTVGFNTTGSGIYNGGTLSPGTAGVAGGGADFGTTNMPHLGGGNFANLIEGPNHHIHIDVGDAGAQDFISIAEGSAQLNGTLDVEYKGTNPQLNAVYDILTAGSGLGGILPTLVSHTPGIEFSEAIVNGGDTLELTITAVPEPATLALTGIGLIALLHRRPRRRGRANAGKSRPPVDPPSPDPTGTCDGPPLPC
jgi:hypothetical protein